jgi:hypothetical protein
MEHIIDRYLKQLLDAELNTLPMSIVAEMSDPNQDKDAEWQIWHPVQSNVTNADIEMFESRIGYQLPESYKRFLKHKHFYELQISACSFCAHPAGIWHASLVDMIFDGYPREFLFDKGRIPFANWSDWGLLCFDTTAQCIDNDYPIVLWDHEEATQFESQFSNFETMLFELDKEERENTY